MPITEIIRNKDPLGLNSDINMNRSNSDIESYTTVKTNAETLSKEAVSPDKTDMQYDAIPHYLKAGNFNNSADTKKQYPRKMRIFLLPCR